MEQGRPHKNVYLLTVVGWDQIEEAERWRDAELLVPITEAALQQLDDDEYYFHQIIGCEVETTAGKHVGKIKEILLTAANDVLVIESASTGKEILVPFVKAFVKKVDLQAGQITVAWMEGLE